MIHRPLLALYSTGKCAKGPMYHLSVGICEHCLEKKNLKTMLEI